MDERNFDLTVPVTRAFRMIWTGLGVIWIFLGFVNLQENTILGVVQLVAGLSLLPFIGLLHRINRYIIAFNDANLEIERGLFRHRRIPWASVSEIHIQLMKVGFRLDNGKSLEINFSNMSFNDNQTVKPEIIATATAFAEAKGIDVKDGRST